MNYISFNGKTVDANEPVLTASNRSYRYGDGLFETMKVREGKIQLENYHFERLFNSLDLLLYEVPTLFSADKLREEIHALCKKNSCEKLARVRLSVSRGQGGLYDGDGKLQYVIEAWPLNETTNQLNENGLVLGLHVVARKSCDEFSSMKTANFLPYVMAALQAKEKGWNDCLVMNQFSGITDATTANVFVINNGMVYTPHVNQGCVDGVMRKFICEKLPLWGYDIQPGTLSIADIEEADEVFLTNAIHGIRWVKEFGRSNYVNTLTREIYDRLLKTIPL